MQERVQRLEAARLSLEEVRTRWLGTGFCPPLGYPCCGLRASSGPALGSCEARGT